MDTSASIDTLNDTPTLPELSFDDLIDESPVKKDKSGRLNDMHEMEDERKKSIDDTLNTPKPKKMSVMAVTMPTTTTTNTTADQTSETSAFSLTNQKSTATTTTSANKIVNTTTVSTASKINLKNITTTTTEGSVATTTTPLLLNSKNLLPKTKNFSNNFIKIAPKVVTTTTTASSNSSAATTKTTTTTTKTTTPTTPITTTLTNLAGRKAMKTPNGQIIYIQKATADQLRLQQQQQQSQQKQTSAVTSATTATTTTPPTGTKTVSIQVIRTSDGSIMPMKTGTTTTKSIASAGSTGGQTMAGDKKLGSSSDRWLVIKAPLKTVSSGSSGGSGSSPTSSTANANSSSSNSTSSDVIVKNVKVQKVNTTAAAAMKPISSTTSAKSTGATASGGAAEAPKASTTVSMTGTPGGRIIVQSANGKHIIVSNQNLLKLSPKSLATGGAAKTATVSAGTLQALKLGNKTSLQNVRVIPAAASKSLLTPTSSTTTTTTRTSGGQIITKASPTTPSSSNPATMKLLNAMPQKFTVVRPSTKVVLKQAPKKEMTGTLVPLTLSPTTSKVQKTVIALPALRPIGGGDTKRSPSTSISSTTSSSGNSAHQSPKQNTASSSNNNNMSLIRKHKISDINSELQRITTNADGPTEPKRLAGNNNSIVVIARSTSGLRPGTTTQVQRLAVQTSQGSSHGTSGSNSSVQPVKKLYSVLKSNNLGGDVSSRRVLTLASGDRASLLLHQQQSGKSLLLKRPQQITAQQQQQQQQQQKEQQQKEQQQKEQQKMQQQQKLLQLQEQQQEQEYASSASGGENGGNGKFVPIRIKEEPYDSPLPGEPSTLVRRKHCNCSKSQCLKLYCDCFANGEFCQDCTCKDCFNNLQYEDERQRAIKMCLDRNPSAFKPKITTSADQGDMRLHNKGCNCKRSGCLKNYCECYEAKIPCSSNCKCVGCRNVEDRPDLDLDPFDPKLLATLTNAPSGAAGLAGHKRSYDKTHGKGNEKLLKDAAKVLGGNSDLLGGGTAGSISGASVASSGSNSGGAAGAAAAEKQQCNFITQEVIDATIQCMISQADECEKNGLPAYQTEKMVMEELGRCLVEIIDFSIRNTDNSFTQD